MYIIDVLCVKTLFMEWNEMKKVNSLPRKIEQLCVPICYRPADQLPRVENWFSFFYSISSAHLLGENKEKYSFQLFYCDILTKIKIF